MIATADSVTLVGMDGHRVQVEVSVAPGLPAFTIVGLPDASIQEARERVRSAIVASEEPWPQARITANLSPAHLRKAGSSFDLAMALAVLACAGRIAQERLAGYCVLGELGLDGAVRRVRGVLPAAIAAADAGCRRLVVPVANAAEASLVAGVEVYGVDHVSRAVRFLRGEAGIDPSVPAAREPAPDPTDLDLTDVRGNGSAKRALEIAAAGGHNLLMIGPPGGGKTMLARRLPSILPPMSEREAFEVTRIYSVAGLVGEGGGLIERRPFRAPHHTASTAGIVGGGMGMPHPGEVSLSHRGVLFLDEYGEFRNETLQALRQPLEDGVVRIVRSRWAVSYPARFQLVAASNPCRCGFHSDQRRQCVCAPGRISSYQERLSGPIVDRIDMQVGVSRLTRRELFGAPEGDPSAVVAARVRAARQVQAARLRALDATCNAELPARDLLQVCRIRPDARATIGRAVDRMALSARSAHRLMRVARTIADLDAAEDVEVAHVEEALGYRLLDRASSVSAP